MVTSYIYYLSSDLLKVCVCVGGLPTETKVDVAPKHKSKSIVIRTKLFVLFPVIWWHCPTIATQTYKEAEKKGLRSLIFIFSL